MWIETNVLGHINLLNSDNIISIFIEDQIVVKVSHLSEGFTIYAMDEEIEAKAFLEGFNFALNGLKFVMTTAEGVISIRPLISDRNKLVYERMMLAEFMADRKM